jgi:hypothetical protein
LLPASAPAELLVLCATSAESLSNRKTARSAADDRCSGRTQAQAKRLLCRAARLANLSTRCLPVTGAGARPAPTKGRPGDPARSHPAGSQAERASGTSHVVPRVRGRCTPASPSPPVADLNRPKARATCRLACHEGHGSALKRCCGRPLLPLNRRQQSSQPDNRQVICRSSLAFLPARPTGPSQPR